MLADINDIEQLENCQTTGELEAAATSLAEALGFEYWAYGLDLPVFDDHRRQFLVGGYPDEWLEHYFAHDYLRADPVIAHCQIHTTPFAWPPPDASRHRKGTRRSLSERLFREAGEFGLKSGLAIPVHGLGCSWGLVSFASKARRSDTELRSVLPRAHLIGHFIHEAGHHFACVPGTPKPVHMTARERECLHWVALGKTSWEIGRLLSVSERTVVFHVQNAGRKLDAKSRHAAVARAITLGLINP